jgi:hypothetical protein
MLDEMVDKYLKEASLSRIWKHIEAGRPFGMLTAFRGNKDNIDPMIHRRNNLAKNKQLEAAIRAAGYGFFRMEGHYIEGYGTDAAEDVKEQSFFVIGDEDVDTFKLFLKKQGQRFDQDSIFFFDPDKQKGFLIGTNHTGYPGFNKEESVGKWHPSKVGEFYSKMKRSVFVFESLEQPPCILSLVNDKTLRNKWWSHLED